VRSPMSRLNSRLAYWTMSLSISSPPMRIEREMTMPPSDATATSVVPPPMSTIIEPVGPVPGRPAPTAAAPGPAPRRAPLAPAQPRRLGADREHRAGPLILRDDRRLGDDDPSPPHVHEGVGGAEVDADVPREQAEQTVEQRWGYPFQTRSHVHAKDNGAARQNARGFRVRASVSRRPRSRIRRRRAGE